MTRHRRILTGKRPTKKRLPVRTMQAMRAPAAMRAPLTTEIVPTFLHMLNTVKLYHWKTTSFATHKATDELYATLNEKLDDFVEVMLGKREMGGRAKLLNVALIKLGVYSDNDAFRKQIESYKSFLLAMDESLVMGMKNTDLLAIRDEILAAFNKFLYLLSLGG